MTTENLNELRNELSVKSKNGIDFTLAASIIWLAITFIWTLKFRSYDKSVLVFIVGGLMLPLALLFKKIFKTNWKNSKNPLQPLGLWLNIAQLFYFPFLIFILFKSPDYFVMTYAIITGAHFFPYAWFYKTKWYAVLAGVIAVGALIMAIIFTNENMYLIPLFTSLSLVLLTVLLFFDFKKKSIQ